MKIKLCPRCKTPSQSGICANADCYNTYLCGCRRLLWVSLVAVVVMCGVGMWIL
jgi:hypothetical protein